jgi:molybdopterin molybdotransferase
MAQLSNDCFAFGGDLMRVDEAVALISERIVPVAEMASVLIEEADGRILAEDVIASINLPPFDNSAVDGYAVRQADLSAIGESRLPIVGRIAAGAPLDSIASQGHAIRIFTGAPMPSGFDTVFMQEDVRIEEGCVTLPHGLRSGANRRLAGEDLASGAMAFAAGRRLRAPDIALLAALGRATIVVRRRLRVAVFSTGDEVISPGEPLGESKVYDANRFMLRALLTRAGCTVTDLGILPDVETAVAHGLTSAAVAHDLLVTSGGVSAGDEDHVKAAVESVGSLVFWRVGIKPGRPVAMGVVDGTPFIGLPGNPVAVFVTFAFLARPLIARLAGEDYHLPPPITVTSGFSYKKKEGRREYVRVLLTRMDGIIEARKYPRDGAGVITSLTQTDGFVELPEHVTRVAPGDPVDFLAYTTLL